MQKVTVGICAYNEEGNIGRLIDNLLSQTIGPNFSLLEILVVASGCTDSTVEIVRSKERLDPRVHCIEEEERAGKASALNLVLDRAKGDIIVLESADTLPGEGTLGALLTPFLKDGVGATGSRPIPVNSPDEFWGFVVRMLWNLHHEFSMLEMSLGNLFHISGELCAIRKGLVKEMPPDIVNDDVYLGWVCFKKGYEIVYVPSATVSMRGPENRRDYLSQRRRVLAGHKQIVALTRQEIQTASPTKTLNLLLGESKFTSHPDRTVGLLLRRQRPNGKHLFWTLLAVCFEGYAHLLASLDYRRGGSMVRWEMAGSTKELPTQVKSP